MSARLLSAVAAALLAAGCARGRPAAPARRAEGPEASLRALTPEDRLVLLRGAQVWQPARVRERDLLAGPREPGAFAFDQEVSCEYVDKEPTGVSPKFGCRLDSGDVVKVKFGRKNGEVFAEVAASRLFWALGFGADAVYPVRVLCRRCPIDPWFYQTPQRLEESRFELATIERKMPGTTIEAETEGWSWDELDLVDEAAGGAPRAQRDALRLLAVLVQHGDSKASNQRFICLPGAVAEGAHGAVRCTRPFLLVHDLGSTFGGAGDLSLPGIAKWNFKEWANKPIWREPDRCVGQLNGSLTGSLQHPQISEEGRRFLADLLSQLSDRQIEDLFRAARADRRHVDGEGVGNPAVITGWAQVFKIKRDEIVNHHCPS